jgi:hypothetical protein
MKLSEDGQKSDRKLYDVYCVYNMLLLYVCLTFFGLITICNCSMYGHGLFKIQEILFTNYAKCMWVLCLLRPPTFVKPASCGPIVIIHN